MQILVEVGVFQREWVDHFKRKFHVEVDIAHQPPLVPENQSDYLFKRYQNTGSTLFLFVTKHACIVTDR